MRIVSFRNEIIFPYHKLPLFFSKNLFLVLFTNENLRLYRKDQVYTEPIPYVCVTNINDRIFLENTSANFIKIKLIFFCCDISTINPAQKFLSFIKNLELDGFASLFDLDMHMTEYYNVAISFLRNRVINHIPPNKTKKTNKSIDSRLIKVYRFIRNHYREPLTLQDLSETIQCNPLYLCNTFSKVFGISPIYLINQLRFKEAKQLLIETDLSLSDISKSIGYNSLSQFSSIFKRYSHTSPSSFRKQFRT